MPLPLSGHLGPSSLSLHQNLLPGNLGREDSTAEARAPVGGGEWPHTRFWGSGQSGGFVTALHPHHHPLVRVTSAAAHKSLK